MTHFRLVPSGFSRERKRCRVLMGTSVNTVICQMATGWVREHVLPVTRELKLAPHSSEPTQRLCGSPASEGSAQRQLMNNLRVSYY